MNNFTKKHELETRISELEGSLGELKQQLNSIESTEQHEAIDNLEVYLNAIDHKYSNLRSFWQMLTQEIREIFSDEAKK